MKVLYTGDTARYFDETGVELFEGDTVHMGGRNWKVLKTVDGELGVDSTNPNWVDRGVACEGEFGVYPFSEHDDPILIAVSSPLRKREFYQDIQENMAL